MESLSIVSLLFSQAAVLVVVNIIDKLHVKKALKKKRSVQFVTGEAKKHLEFILYECVLCYPSPSVNV